MTISALIAITVCLALLVVMNVSANSDLSGNPTNNTSTPSILPQISQNRAEGPTTTAATSTETNQVVPKSEPLEMPLIEVEANMTTETQIPKTSQLLPYQSPRNDSPGLHVKTDQSKVLHVPAVANIIYNNSRNFSMSLPDVTSVRPPTPAFSDDLPQGLSSSETPVLPQMTSILGNNVPSEVFGLQEPQEVLVKDSKGSKPESRSSSQNVSEVPLPSHGSETSTFLPPAAVKTAKTDEDFSLQNITSAPHLLSPSTTPVEDHQLQDAKKTAETSSSVIPVTERVDHSVANARPSEVLKSTEAPSTGVLANTTEKDQLPSVTSKDSVESSTDTSSTNSSFVSDFWSTVGPLVILCIGIAMVMVYFYHKKCNKRSNEPPQVIVVRDASDWTFRVSGSNRHGSSRRH